MEKKRKQVKAMKMRCKEWNKGKDEIEKAYGHDGGHTTWSGGRLQYEW